MLIPDIPAPMMAMSTSGVGEGEVFSSVYFMVGGGGVGRGRSGGVVMVNRLEGECSDEAIRAVLVFVRVVERCC